LYSYIRFLNSFRSQVINASSDYLTYFNWVVHNDTNTLAMRKGYDGRQVITVLNNDGEAGVSRALSLSNEQTGYNSSIVVTDVISCTNLTVDGNGTLSVTIANGLPNVFYPASLLADSTICHSTTTATLPSATATSSPKPKKNGAVKVGDWDKLAFLGVCSWIGVDLANGMIG
jgi:alpha-amylase